MGGEIKGCQGRRGGGEGQTCPSWPCLLALPGLGFLHTCSVYQLFDCLVVGGDSVWSLISAHACPVGVMLPPRGPEFLLRVEKLRSTVVGSFLKGHSTETGWGGGHFLFLPVLSVIFVFLWGHPHPPPGPPKGTGLGMGLRLGQSEACRAPGHS